MQQLIFFDMSGNEAYESNYGQFYYDNSKQMIRIDILDGKTNLGGSPSTYSVSFWQDYANQIEYILDRTSNVCTSIPLTTHIGSGQLPSDAIYGASLLLGSQPVYEYFYKEHYEGMTYQFEVGLMSGTCLPYNVEIFNTTSNGNPHKLVATEAFWNAVPSVPPFVLDIPSECTSSSVQLLHAFDLDKRIFSIHESLRFHAVPS
eukprot:CAMPEP_0117015628 /NCGR_PEP_ID=MMETSP0472-20121206/12447_1 /TAXON_ID=693140 ORGANISM="Tiarina fusus, Strain LIS" /NCGR_SAMPLE_ID=MMETSP0472 /ASSEMBLY_ACC=CAM_ASM_000603 /LENGTH=202 /DNA_ID=CAMNT_0004719465 /DNA_START=114 /DNA_END=719 /DNA_ORIENTATION=+